MKRTLPKRETETENYPHTVSRRCPFPSHGLHDPWELIDAEEEEKCYINNNNNNTRERMMIQKQQSPPVHRQDKNRQRRRPKKLVQETCSQSITLGRSKTENERKSLLQPGWLMRKIHKTLTLTLIWISLEMM